MYQLKRLGLIPSTSYAPVPSETNERDGATSPLLPTYSDEQEQPNRSRPWPRGTSRHKFLRPAIVVFGLFAVVTGLGFYFRSTPVESESSESSSDTSPSPPWPKNPTSPADGLDTNPVAAAQLSLDVLFARQSKTLEEAAARYSLKADRPPPPNFDKWFAFTQQKKCLVDDYDQILRDFEPFYQLAADAPTHFESMVSSGRSMIEKDSNGMITLSIKDGKLHMPGYSRTAFDGDWPGIFGRFASVLPDMDFLLNGRDEPRVVFNYREPGARKEALTLKDTNPFHLTPHPTADFFHNRSGCRPLSTDKGFTSDASADISFLRSSSTADFTTDLWPLLSMTKISPCFSDILFPGPYSYDATWWSGSFAHPNDVVWKDKKEQVYWRGMSNGGHISGQNYRKFPRFRLVELARNHSDLIDARMTRFAETHCTDDTCDRDGIIKEYDIGGPMSPKEDIYHYKYLLDVDGNTFSGRYFGLLRSGSLVFKSTVFDEYFNEWLRPYVHYIPVQADLSDLVEKIEWAIAHDNEARLIQETGKLWADRVLTDSQNDCYFSAVLLEWARLQGYAKNANSTAGL
ncbi:glycosyl transferase family 90-domain-containing protein [Mycena rebaudengoi]|nr:glycosyl transferase family 90-domain-containing protein [Mycena rebaudengoi]